jgi:hypothetical protein
MHLILDSSILLWWFSAALTVALFFVVSLYPLRWLAKIPSCLEYFERSDEDF